MHAALGAELGLIVAMLAMAAHQLVGVGAVGGGPSSPKRPERGPDPGNGLPVRAVLVRLEYTGYTGID